MAIARSLVRGGLSFGLVACTLAGAERLARANGLEIPENGTEVMGRAGAWTAKADNPLAGALNPAGLAGQPTALILNANITYQSMCFEKAGVYPTPSANGGTKWESGGYEGQPYPKVCKANGFGDLNVVPQIGFNYAVNSKLGIALLPLWTPSGTGSAKWPTEVNMPGGGTAPSPSRFLLVSKDAKIIMPTLAAGYEVARGLRFGAGFQWVITDVQVDPHLAGYAELGREHHAGSEGQHLVRRPVQPVVHARRGVRRDVLADRRFRHRRDAPLQRRHRLQGQVV
jgi:long-chain fatty acid transport protein